MDNQKHYTKKSFKKSLIVCGMIFTVMIFMLSTRGTEYASSGLFVGLPILIASLIGAIGLIEIIKGRKEKKTLKFFFAFIINGLIATFLLVALISNFIDIANAIL